jgi:hypothetical protein
MRERPHPATLFPLSEATPPRRRSRHHPLRERSDWLPLSAATPAPLWYDSQLAGSEPVSIYVSLSAPYAG